MKRLLLCLFCLLSTITIAQTTWTGLGANTNWNNTDNWDTNLVPTASDDVIIPTGFIVTLNVIGDIKSLDIQGNSVFDVNTNMTLTDTYTIGSSAIVNWNSGVLQGDGTLTNNGTINFPTTSAKSIYGTTVLNNEGVMNFQATGYLYLYGDSILNNTLSGVIDFQDDAVISYSGAGAFNFINTGMLKKTGGIGTSTVQPRMTNTGTISVESGTLTMNAIEKTFDGGVYNVTTGNTLLLSVNVNVNGTLTGQLDGSLNLASTLSVATTATLDFTGSGFNWNSGILQGDGTLINNGIMNFPTTSSKSIYGTTVLNNEGVMNFQSTGYLYLYGDSTLNNTLSGVIDFQDNAAISYSGAGAFSFNNIGMFKKTGGIGISPVQARMINTGTISVESGTLTMNAIEKTFDGGVYNVTTGNTLLLSVNVNVNGTLTGQLDGSLNLASTLSVATTATLDFTGSGFNWNSGILQGDGALTNNGTINLPTTSAKSIYGTTVLNNEGVMNFQSTGYIYLYGDSTFNNQLSGVIDFQNNAVISYSGAGAFSFNNAGLITKTLVTGTSLIYPPTTNSGIIDVRSGEIEFIGNFGFTNTVDGIIKGTAAFDLPLPAYFTNDGTFAPGASPGILSVIGDYTSTSNSVLDIELDGLIPEIEYDVLAITGTNVIFEGSVNITMGFEADENDTFDIATTSGTISTQNLVSPIIVDHDGKRYTFDVSYPNDNIVRLTITDKLDILPPDVITQNITVQLDASGNASITAAQIDNGTTDNCTPTNELVFSLDITDFTCADLGDNTVNLTVTDNDSNEATLPATVTVEDSILPTVVTQNITVQLDASGTASISTGDIDNGSSDNCSVSSMSLDVTDFTCSDLGANTVNLTVTDQSGNSDAASATVTVEDSVSPTVVTQNITVQLDASGTASISTGDIDNGSSDNCSVSSMSLDVTDFTCSDLGANTVNLTVTDQSGNSDAASAIVTVEDNVSPTVVTQNITVQLNASGTASINTGDIDNGSSDNCSVSSMSLDVTDFTCSDLGANTVNLTVTDQSGNSDATSATVTVEDLIAPQVVCPGNINIETPGDDYSIPDYFALGDAIATDNCTNPITNVVQTPAPGTLVSDGDFLITITATDASGNESECTFNLHVDKVLSIDSPELTASQILLYPNPASQKVTLKNISRLNLVDAEIIDVTGKLLRRIDLSEMSLTEDINIETYSNGMYFIRINALNSSITKRLIKQ